MIAADRLAAVADALERDLCHVFDAEVITKEDSLIHRAVALGFDAVELGRAKVAELAALISLDPPRLGLPTGAEYLTEYGTTIASTVALPRSWREPGGALTRLLVVPHEVVHVSQHQRGVNAGWWPAATSHSVLYLCSVATDDAAEYLGKVEADAYATTECVRAWLSGSRRPLAEIVQSLRQHYALKPAGALVAEAVLTSHYATLDDGGVPPVTVCRWTIDWLSAHAADLKGAVVA